MWNETPEDVSLAEYNLTGTDTRPKEIVAVPIERAAMRKP
jgi:hypothetical protein